MRNRIISILLSLIFLLSACASPAEPATLKIAVLPIIDMGARFGLTVDDLAKRRVIIVVLIGTKLVGLLVDAVCDILAVPDDTLHAAPELAGDTISSFVTAVLTIEERMICLISLGQLLPEQDAVAA